MGLSQRAALEHIATLGNMFKQLGAGSDTAAENSKSMVQLSADLASFNNVAGGAESVLEGMQAAFRGEYDSLQRYIPTINAASVEQQALAMTGKASKDALTDLEKATAAMTIIMNGAGIAVGHFGENSERAKNQEQTLSGEMENLLKAVGQYFAPAATAAKSAAIEWTRSLTELIEKHQQLVALQSKMGSTSTTDPIVLMERQAGALRSRIGQMEFASQDSGLFRRPFSQAALDQTREDMEEQNRIIRAFRSYQSATFTEVADTHKSTSEEMTKEEKKRDETFHDLMRKYKLQYLDDLEEATAKFTQEEKDRAAVALRYQRDQIAMGHFYLGEFGEVQEDMSTKLAIEAEKRYQLELDDFEKREKASAAFLEGIHRATADTFYDLYSGNLKGWDDMLSSMKDLFIRYLAEMTAEAIARPILLPIISSVVGGAASAGGGFLSSAAGSVAGKLGWSGASGLFGSSALSMPVGASVGEFGAVSGGLSGMGLGAAGTWGAAALGVGGLAAIPLIMSLFGDEKTKYGVVGPGQLAYNPETGSLDVSGFDVEKDYGMGSKLKEAFEGYVQGFADNFESMTDRLEHAMPEIAGTMEQAIKDFSAQLGTESAKFITSENDNFEQDLETLIANIDTVLESEANEFAVTLGYATAEELLAALAKFEAAMATSAQTMGTAFKAGIEAGSWAEFEVALNKSIYDQVLDGFINAMMQTTAFQRILQPFFLGFSDALDTSLKEGVFSLENFKTMMDPLFVTMQDGIASLQPLFEASSGYFNDLKTSLGLNIPQAASGMDYVPRDMPVFVHRGERIQTKQEADDYRTGKGQVQPVMIRNEFRFKDRGMEMLGRFIDVRSERARIRGLKRGVPLRRQHSGL